MEDDKVFVDFDQRFSAPPRLTAAEGVALAAAAELLRPASTDALTGALAKLEKVLPEGARARYREMSKQLEEAFERRPRDDWLRDLEGIEACVGPVNDMADAVADPQVRHRGMIAQMDGRAVGPGSPFRFDGEHATAARPAPELGEHTAEVLAGIEVGESELAKLRTLGVV